MTGDLLAAMAESWPPEAVVQVGPWLLRQAPGAGNRVTCATATGPVSPADITALADAARGLGQTPTVMLRPGEVALDRLLADQGWRMGEDVVLYHGALDAIGPAPPVLTTFPLWPPLGVMRLMWAEDGTGPEKQRVMDRAPLPRTAILGRTGDRAAGTAFVSMVREVAFLHALTVVPALRRQGTARNIVCAAAGWAREQGATHLALAVTRGNAGARALYASFGMDVVGQYHYRIA
jgi:GNAT superfamily N-acetyltransferase